MCGFIIYSGPDVKSRLPFLIKSHQLLSNRGLDQPDCQNYVVENNGFISHNTLPLDNFDPEIYSQPRFNSFGSLYVFTGQIFNWEKIAEDNSLDVNSDIEFVNKVIKSNQMRDEGIIEQLDGFWTYAKLRRNGELYAINDYLSQKPIYYRTDCKMLSSEPVALVGQNEEFDEVFFSNVRKWGYDPTGRTSWSKIKQLPPGHEYVDGFIRPYYNWNKVRIENDSSPEYLKLLILNSINDRTKKLDEVHMLLSGGLDSSLIYKGIQFLNKKPIVTYHTSSGYNDESRFAKMIDPNIKICQSSPLTQLKSLMIHQSPVDLGSVIPQIHLSRSVKSNVILTGDGADELFGGYKRAKDYDSQSSDVFCELPYYHLPKIDRAMMRRTIETRCPLLNNKIVKFALQMKHSSRTDKQILKAVAEMLGVPFEIINRQKQPLKTKQIALGTGNKSSIESQIRLFRSIFNEDRNIYEYCRGNI